MLERTFSICGTPEYLPPEVYKQAGHSYGVDWWATGVITCQLAAGFSPFAVESDNDWDSLVMVTKFEKAYPNITLPEYFTDELRSVVLKLLHPRPAKRYGAPRRGAHKVMRHAFFKGFDWPALEKQQMKAPYVPTVNTVTDAGNFEGNLDDEHEADDNFTLREDELQWARGF
jgi:serine/threonine protein kinase